MYKKAEAGIGTLILFIAMILVAAVAAGVLIQTTSSLQSKALATGNKAETQISTQVLVGLLYGTNGTDGILEDFFVEMKLAPGSDPIKLNDTLVEFVLSNVSSSLRNNGTGFINCSPTANSSHFRTLYLVQGPNYQPDYLQLGDAVQICFRASRTVRENENFQLQIIPRSGGMSAVTSSSPEVMTTFKVDLWP